MLFVRGAAEGRRNVTGLRREELAGTDYASYFTDPARAREGHERTFSGGVVTDYSLTIRHRDGHLTDVLCNATVYRAIRPAI